MKKIILLLLLFFGKSSYSQSAKKITVDFNNADIIEAIYIIESKSDFTFFYIETWFDQKKKYTNSFQNASINSILNYLFEETTINYYLLEENKVILTNNSKIYPDVLTTKAKSNEAETSENIVSDESTIPTLISRDESYNDLVQIVRIGKETSGVKPKQVTLQGYVTNASNSKPISDLILLEKGKNITATTDKRGFYSIKLPYGINIIETVLTGIEKRKIKFILYSDGNYNFNLTESAELLDEVVIETNARRNTRSTITGLTNIKSEEIKVVPQVLGERDLLKIAETLPGISSAGEGSDGLNVRGGKVDQNLFLLDNATLYNPNHFLGLFTAINPYVTEDINIYKGNIPAKFGGRISSVFEAIPKESKAEKFNGEASIGPVTSNLSLDIPIVKDKAGLLVAGRSTYSNWILRAVENDDLNRSSASFYDLNLRYSHKIDENNSIKISGYYSHDDFSIASDTTNVYENRIASLEWKHTFNEKNSGSLHLSNSSYSFDIDEDSGQIDAFQFRYKIDEINFGLHMTYLHSNEHKINYGIASKLYRMDPGEITPNGENSLVAPLILERERALESALYIADDYTVNEKLSFNLGVRFNLFSAFGPQTVRTYEEGLPRNESTVNGEINFSNNENIKTYNGLSFRLSGRYFLIEDLSLKASISNTYQYIHRLTNNTTASPTDTWKLADFHIKPQEAIQASLGIYKNINGNEFEISLEGYYKALDNILDYKLGANLLINENVETQVLQGPGKSYGAEFLIRKNKGSLNGWLSYTYSRSFLRFDSQFAEETVSNGEYFPTNFDKPHNLNLIVNYRITKRFSFSGNFVYQTGRPITYPIGKYVVDDTEFLLFSERNKFRVPDFYRLDLGFNVEGDHRRKKVGHSFWNISVYNVLGRNNPFSQFFVSEDGTVRAFQSSIFANPIPTITYNFKF